MSTDPNTIPEPVERAFDAWRETTNRAWAVYNASKANPSLERRHRAATKRAEYRLADAAIRAGLITHRRQVRTLISDLTHTAHALKVPA